MFNPLEMFQTQGEAGFQALGQPFGLTTEQTARAFEALMPALTLGLQRSVGMDPNSFGRMFGLPEAARPAAPQGLDALSQMFGSAQLLQGVLRQASATSGVGAQVLRQMLPMMAGAVVASIVHVMLNQPQGEPAQARASAPPPPGPFPFGPAWAEMAKAFMPPTQAPKAAPKSAPNPSGAKAADAKAGEAGSDMLQQMLRTGAEVQGNNIRAMQDLFETFWPSAGTPPQGAPQGNAAPARAPSPPDPTVSDAAAAKSRRGRPPGGTA
ncbi:DUF937 domain-containing protein [Methylobacterium sp. J-026]|uniref:DUF937 domain-containing protein n=1 Tax=Methylobacterium sp. J-026 TaxID=2836624 RepID=UPI001FBAC612|nr:DUF937 domain-containing protein [Methylobacterium sp. J-026]MCJ2137748.1 DUF937 domain-containing protein [Methylobacterium sp. J-026]